jgi:hypothetical protein
MSVLYWLGAAVRAIGLNGYSDEFVENVIEKRSAKNQVSTTNHSSFFHRVRTRKEE